MLVASSPIRLFALAVAGQFLFGVVLALPGTLFAIRGWTEVLGFDVTAQARLLVLFFAGQFLCTALAGRLVDRYGAQHVLVLGGVLMACGFALLAQAETPGAASLGTGMLAAGGSAINAGSNTLVSITYGQKRGSMLSLMAMFGAFGALVAPLLFRGHYTTAEVSGRLWVLVLASLIVAALPAVVAASPQPMRERRSGEILALLRERQMIGLIVLLALEFGNEAVLAGWSAAYAIAVFPQVSGGFIVGMYWSGLCLGRIITPALLARMPKLVLVLTAATVTGIAICGMALAPVPEVLVIAAFVAGLSVGPQAPTIVSVAGDRYARHMGAAIGLLLSAAQIGGMVLPWLTGRATVAAGYRSAMVVPALACFALAAATALTWHARARRGVMLAVAEDPGL